MSKKTIIFLIIAIALPVVIYFLLPSEEKRIKKVFKEGSVAIEKEDIDKTMSKVSYNYKDEHGFSYLYVKEFLKIIFKRFENIQINYKIIKIDITKNRAVVEANVIVSAYTGENFHYLLGDISNPAAVKFSLEKERGKWLIVNTEGLPFHNE